MKTIKDIIADVVKEIDAEDLTDNEKQIVEGIKSLIRELRDSGESGMNFEMYSADDLSKIAGRLVILKVSLGDMISKAGRNFKVAENAIKLRKANLREPVIESLKQVKDKPTVDDIKSNLDKQVFEHRIRANFKEEGFSKLQHLWWSVKDILNVISQRINIKLSEGSEKKWLDEEVVPSADLATFFKDAKKEAEKTSVNTTMDIQTN